MAWHYRIHTVRWRRHTGNTDVRAVRGTRGWKVFAFCLDEHPITHKPLKSAQWWIRETYVGK